VEVLNGIASSFSAFATMPAPVVAEVEITALLKSVVALFGQEAHGSVHFDPPPPMMILGDGQLLARIFSNIILNGLQSGAYQKRVTVEVRVRADGDWSIIEFRDNGMGISPDLRTRIFIPHFTTKKSGSGLGLAIAKQGIEQMGGSIWFETKEARPDAPAGQARPDAPAGKGEGTVFFVKLRVSSPPA
jgi:signal transduction histidine kinase